MRLPEFLYRLSPVGEVLTALETGEENLRAEVEERNSRLNVSTADEAGLTLWERDFGLTDSAGSGLDARRTRIRAALAGSQTLTPAAMKALALSVGRADYAAVTEKLERSIVTLQTLYNGEVDQAAQGVLREVLERLKPAHLKLQILTDPAMGNQELCYNGPLAQGLRVARHSLAACANSTHALFAGGLNGTTPQAATDAYDRDLSRVSAPSLSNSAQLLRAAAAGELLTVSGGCNYRGTTNYSTVNAFNSALTRSTLAALAAAAREHMAASAGNYAVHAGGYPALAQAAAYDENGVKTVLSALSEGRQGGVGATFLRRAVIAGSGTAVDAYDETLTRTVPCALAAARSYPKAAAAGDHLLVAGGSGQNGVEAYDGDFVRSAVPDLLFSEVWSGAGLDGYAVFHGGPVNDKLQADGYSALLTKVAVKPPAYPVGGAAAVLGAYMLFAGSESDAHVECYEVI